MHVHWLAVDGPDAYALTTENEILPGPVSIFRLAVRRNGEGGGDYPG